jgi:hypothetical protein
VNPCAFATLIFFVSLLGTLRRRRREIVAAGAAFAIAVFATYFLLGLGAFRAVKAMSVSSGVATALNLGIGVFALVLGILSFRDAWRCHRSGNAGEMSLKLPEGIRRRINRLISTRLRTGSLVGGAFALGVTVSLLESLCTGQMYLPTIMVMTRDPILAPRAVLWLLLYNLAFILPLLGVFALAVAGAGTRTFLKLSRRHTVPAKCFLGLFFLLLAALLFGTL